MNLDGRNLQIGMQGSDVIRLQQELIQLMWIYAASKLLGETQIDRKSFYQIQYSADIG